MAPTKAWETEMSTTTMVTSMDAGELREELAEIYTNEAKRAAAEGGEQQQ